MPTPAVIVVAGIDPGGAAGGSVDVAFLGRLGVRAAPVVATLTVRDSLGLRRVEPVDDVLFEQQLDAALDLLGPHVRGVLAGLVVAPAQARLVARVAAARGLPLVFDPAILTISVARFGALDAASLAAPLVEAATLVTPQAAEAAALAGALWDRTRGGLLQLARALAGPARTAAVGGRDLEGDEVPLAVVGPAGEQLVEARRAARPRLAGGGTAFAACAAGYLALGLPAHEAAAAAHRLVAEASAGADGNAGPEPWAV